MMLGTAVFSQVTVRQQLALNAVCIHMIVQVVHISKRIGQVETSS